jgi:hypothetical protein
LRATALRDGAKVLGKEPFTHPGYGDDYEGNEQEGGPRGEAMQRSVPGNTNPSVTGEHSKKTKGATVTAMIPLAVRNWLFVS